MTVATENRAENRAEDRAEASDWFRSTPTSERLLSEERLILEVSEVVCEALEKRGRLRGELAKDLNISPSEISQRLGGRRNLSLRTVADMLDVLDYSLEVRLVDRQVQHAGLFATRRLVDWPSESAYKQGPGLRLVRGSSAA